MSLKFSTGLRNKMLDGGSGGGIKGALNLGKINIYTGSQPPTADAAATGTLLGTVTVNGAGTGLTFDAAAAGVIAKAAAETWKFTGLAAGIAGWFRFYPASGTPANLSTTEARIDGAAANSGGDMTISNVNVETGAISTVDACAFTMAQA